uniref:NOP2/Sun RNA methyltransferase 6 n=2 Tax=Erpetoichthys calabaricus TaxID=27687 RepID=A0A8C4RPR4_ERPCA
MDVFPKLLLRPEVEDHLRNTFRNAELLHTLSHEEANRRFEQLLSRLSHPPPFTTLRVNTHLASVDWTRDRLSEELQQQLKTLPSGEISILQHPELPDVLLIPVIGPRRSLESHSSEVIVGLQCGNAVLRGAHVFVPGIQSAPKNMKIGDQVSVYSDIGGKCRRGAKEFQGEKIFVGNGIAEVSRAQIFLSDEPPKGVGIRMTEPVYLSPCFDSLLPNFIFLQNLPSVVVGHVLAPKPGEKILDMCAAPGGKTTHIATLMHDQGEVIAMDKIASKVAKVRQKAEILKLQCIKAFCFDGTKAVSRDHTASITDEPPFPPESFDKILLDAPCSGLGQRPSMACLWTLREVTSYQPLQRKLFSVAVELLRPGGTLVYSTCTVTLAENEEQVAWALRTFPHLRLQPQDPHLGAGGMPGAGLSEEHLKLLQRFSPMCCATETNSITGDAILTSDLVNLANKDTIGFFIAKFKKL